MKLATNHFKKAIAAGQKQIGLWVTLADGLTAELVAGAGFDWVVIDTEHSPGDGMDTAAQLQAFAGRSTSVFVRPAWNNAVEIKRLLDMGAQGLVIPMVQSVEEAKAAVAATRYPPRGNRGFAGGTRATGFGRITDYVARIEDELVVILQLESAQAIAHADEIAALDGVDGIFFGPADIAADLGHLGKPMHADVWAMINPVMKRLTENGTPCGTLVIDPTAAIDLLNDGFTFVITGTDAIIFARAVDGVAAQVRTGIA